MPEQTPAERGLDWQRGIWNRIAGVYRDEIDRRFVPVVEHAIALAALRPGDLVLDLGCGTGAVTAGAAIAVSPGGSCIGVDISVEMLTAAERLARATGLSNVAFREGRAEALPARDGEFDAIIATLSLMYAIDRSAAAHECARVLRQGGRFVAAVWGGPDVCDLVRFQSTVGRFAPAPPVPGVGPGALADPSPFVEQLAQAGIVVRVELANCDFAFDSLDSAWDIVASVTAAQMTADGIAQAKAAIRDEMWPDPEHPRAFRNQALFLVGARAT